MNSKTMYCLSFPRLISVMLNTSFLVFLRHIFHLIDFFFLTKTFLQSNKSIYNISENKLDSLG